MFGSVFDIKNSANCSGSRNYAGTPCIYHQGIRHKNGHLIITHPRITILTNKQKANKQETKKRKKKQKEKTIFMS